MKTRKEELLEELKRIEEEEKCDYNLKLKLFLYELFNNGYFLFKMSYIIEEIYKNNKFKLNVNDIFNEKLLVFSTSKSYYGIPVDALDDYEFIYNIEKIIRFQSNNNNPYMVRDLINCFNENKKEFLNIIFNSLKNYYNQNGMD